MGRIAKRAGSKSPEAPQAAEQTIGQKAAQVRGIAYLSADEYRVFKACALRMGHKPDEQVITTEAGSWMIVRVFNHKITTE
jgi:hypothetical protein